MKNDLSLLVGKLEQSITDDTFIDVAYSVVEELEEKENAFDAVEPLLVLFENYPNVDFGLPGPIVHFVERFYKLGYEEKLIESINRKPTQHTIWMLNRLINGSHGDKKAYFISVLGAVINDSNVDREIVMLAQHFKSLHV